MTGPYYSTILNLVKERGQLKAAEIYEEVGISRQSVSNYLAEMHHDRDVPITRIEYATYAYKSDRKPYKSIQIRCAEELERNPTISASELKERLGVTMSQTVNAISNLRKLGYNIKGEVFYVWRED